MGDTVKLGLIVVAVLGGVIFVSAEVTGTAQVVGQLMRLAMSLMHWI